MNYRIPEGWTAEPAFDVPQLRDRYLLLRHPDLTVGMVTIDWKLRVFRFGCATTMPPNSVKKYGGRGWQQAIVDDACGALDATRFNAHRGRR